MSMIVYAGLWPSTAMHITSLAGAACDGFICDRLRSKSGSMKRNNSMTRLPDEVAYSDRWNTITRLTNIIS